MKVIILDTVYRDFLRRFHYFYNESLDFDTYHKKLMGKRFGVSDAYGFYLRSIGVDAKEVISNDFIGYSLQKYPSIFRNIFMSSTIKRSRYLDLMIEFIFRNIRIFESLIIDVVREFNPDVIHCQDVGFFSDSFFKHLNDRNTLLVGQIAGPLPPLSKFKYFDIVLSSLPNYVSFFKENGIPSQYFRLGFDARVVEEVRSDVRDLDFTFVGGLGRHHKDWISSLEAINTIQPIQVFGYGKRNLGPGSSLRKGHNGEVWGTDMYAVFARSKITLNRHISISGPYANNMRLYEATGMGSLLLTDNKVNISEIFEPGKEVIVYNSPQEAAQLAKHYLDNPEEAKEIARNGQKKTLSHHSYELRMQELKSIYEYHLERL